MKSFKENTKLEATVIFVPKKIIVILVSILGIFCRSIFFYQYWGSSGMEWSGWRFFRVVMTRYI